MLNCWGTGARIKPLGNAPGVIGADDMKLPIEYVPGVIGAADMKFPGVMGAEDAGTKLPTGVMGALPARSWKFTECAVGVPGIRDIGAEAAARCCVQEAPGVPGAADPCAPGVIGADAGQAGVPGIGVGAGGPSGPRLFIGVPGAATPTLGVPGICDMCLIGTFAPGVLGAATSKPGPPAAAAAAAWAAGVLGAAAPTGKEAPGVPGAATPKATAGVMGLRPKTVGCMTVVPSSREMNLPSPLSQPISNCRLAHSPPPIAFSGTHSCQTFGVCSVAVGPMARARDPPAKASANKSSIGPAGRGP